MTFDAVSQLCEALASNDSTDRLDLEGCGIGDKVGLHVWVYSHTGKGYILIQADSAGLYSDQRSHDSQFPYQAC